MSEKAPDQVAASEPRPPILTHYDYCTIYRLVFRDGYPGYKPEVKEIPNGDGKVDAQKRYAHVAPKYLTDAVSEADKVILRGYLEQVHAVAEEAARAAGVPEEFMPRIEYGALRILEYPPGAISNKHEDFDLFTLMCHRSDPSKFSAEEVERTDAEQEVMRALRAINEQAHIGQLGAEIGLGPATPHEVLPSPAGQHSVVYFAIPDHDAVLPSGVTVRDWLNERMARSRTEFKKYE